jgi:hypothetical protein
MPNADKPTNAGKPKLSYEAYKKLGEDLETEIQNIEYPKGVRPKFDIRGINVSPEAQEARGLFYENNPDYLDDRSLHIKYDKFIEKSELDAGEYGKLPEIFKNEEYYHKLSKEESLSQRELMDIESVTFFGRLLGFKPEPTTKTVFIYERRKSPEIMWTDWYSSTNGGRIKRSRKPKKKSKRRRTSKC